MSKVGEKEIRFAVVMYGGVSLAIYINGVAQELLKMARATEKKDNLDSTESIYRKIACLLANEALMAKAAQAKSVEEARQLLKDLDASQCSPVKFIVDILSGTSAGGINAVFLAKALANRQDIGQLKQLWLNEGDIAKLINDKKSVADIDLNAQKQPKSLLNSQRMYYKLLEALDEMGDDPAEENEAASKSGKEIDLFVTVTDFNGVPIPLRLLDGVVYERRHRHVFRFRYDKNSGENDFTKEHNPMLAFAARSTSAFPFAFEPMRLSEAGAIIEEGFPQGKSRNNLKTMKKKFFPEIKDSDGKTVEWKDRDLVDGGYLDNKPFSYAIDALANRRADFQVERKLIYIEPSPETFRRSDKKTEKTPPDALENAIAAVSELPRYETIREDLQRLLERNRLIDRIKQLSINAEKDFLNAELSITRDRRDITPDKVERAEKKEAKPETTETNKQLQGGELWEKRSLLDIVKIQGAAVLPYYRLRIMALTDEIARLVTRKLGIEENSEFSLAIRALVRRWREENYHDYSSQSSGGKQPVLAFLRRFDLEYRLRRLRFVLQKAEELARFDETFRKNLEERQNKMPVINREREKTESARPAPTVQPAEVTPAVVQTTNQAQSFVEEAIIGQAPAVSISTDGVEPASQETAKTPSEMIWEFTNENAEGVAQLREIVNYFINELGVIFEEVQKGKENLYSRRAAADGLRTALEKINLKSDDLNELLKLAGQQAREDASLKSKGNKKIFDQIKEAALVLENLLKAILDDNRNKVGEILQKDAVELPERLRGKTEPRLFKAVRGYLSHYYGIFDSFDQISFPIFYETPVGEAVTVDVLRISPSDAKSLIDETKPGETRRKLAGTKFYNFGAFLDRVWRKNDIMWGRLDGAERLITALLPGENLEFTRKVFVKQAQEIILAEEISATDKDDLGKLWVESLVNAGAGLELRNVIDKFSGKVSDEKVKKTLNALLQNYFREDQIYDLVHKHYEVERGLEPKSLLRALSRSTQVTGKIFENIADRHGQSADRLLWVSRLGQIFWGLVEVAAPNSFWNLLFYHWLKLLYFFELILIVGGSFLVNKEAQQFGIAALSLTILTHLTVTTLNSYMKGGRFLQAAGKTAVGAMIISAIIGALFMIAFLEGGAWWNQIKTGQENWAKIPPAGQIWFSAILALFVFYLTSDRIEKIQSRSFWKTFFACFGFFIIINIILVWLRLTGTQENLVRFLWVDSFIFVPFYVGALNYLTQLLRLVQEKWMKILRIAAMISIFIAALADVAENSLTYSALKMTPGSVPQWLSDIIFWASTVKWISVAAVLIILLSSLIYWLFKYKKVQNRFAKIWSKL